MSTHEEYTKIIAQRYGDNATGTYEQRGDYSFALMAPAQYLVEASMLRFVKQNPSATLKDVCSYFGKITPIGLAPGDDGADLLEDE